MPTIDEYIDEAKRVRGFRSDRELSNALGFKNNSVSHWRTKRAWPSDESMVTLAELAGMPPEQALLDLNFWRSTGQAKSVYATLAARIAAAIIAITLPLSASAARTIMEHCDAIGAVTVYYGKSHYIIQYQSNVPASFSRREPGLRLVFRGCR